MNVYTRIALASSLSAVASVGLLTTQAKAFSLTASTINLKTEVLAPFAGDVFVAPATVVGTSTANWAATTSGGPGTIFLDWVFQHAGVFLSGTETYLSQNGSVSGSISKSLTAFNLAEGDYVTLIGATLRAAKGSNPNFTYKSNADSVQWSVSPVPEPITMLGSGMALGFGAFLKRKQKASEKKIKS